MIHPNQIKVVYYDCPNCQKENIFGRPEAERTGFSSSKMRAFTCKQCGFQAEVKSYDLKIVFKRREEIESEYGPIEVLQWISD